METEKPRGLDMTKQEEPESQIPTPSGVDWQVVEDTILHFSWAKAEILQDRYKGSEKVFFTELSLEKALKELSATFETQWLKVADIQTWDTQYSFLNIPPGTYRYNIRHRETNGEPGPIASAQFDVPVPEPVEVKIKTSTLAFFEYEHLPIHLQKISQPFCELADLMEEMLEASPEKSAGMRKLLEAKDCFVRCGLND